MKNNTIIHQIVLLLLFSVSLIVSSCSPSLTPISQISLSTTLPPTKVMPTLTLTLEPTESLTPSELTNPNHITINCAKTSNNNSVDITPNGLIVFTSQSQPGYSYLLDLKTGKRIVVSDSSTGFVISPNGEKLAYIDYQRNTLVVTDSSNSKPIIIQNADNGLKPAQWLDNKRLVLNKTSNQISVALDSLVILDLFTKEEKELNPGYPDIRDGHNQINWQGYASSRAIPNPSLTYLVYPIKGEGRPVVLWNIDSGSEVRKIYWSDYWSTPWWSPDGKQFIISASPSFDKFTNVENSLNFIGGSELFSVAQTGEIKRLTYLTTTYFAIEFGYIWSPDGQKVAFWFRDKNNSTDNSWRLATLDIKSGVVTDNCLTNPNTSILIWSLNSEGLLLTTEKDGIIFVDIRKNIISHVIQDGIAIGWMATTP